MTDEIITLREYARRKEVSLTAVQKAARPEVGRIVPERDESGRITGINWTTQAAAWEANAKGNYKPHTLAGGRPRNDGAPPKKPAASKSAAPAPAPSVPPGDGKQPMSISDIQRARELVKLQIDSIKLKEAQGEFVPSAEQERQGQALGGAVISGLYNIAERISDELAGMTNAHDINALLIREFDQAVEGLRKLMNAN